MASDPSTGDKPTNISISTSTFQCDVNENIEIYINFEGGIPDVIGVYEDEEIIDEIYFSGIHDINSNYNPNTQIYTYIPTTPGSHTIYLSNNEINSNSLSFSVNYCPHIYFDESYGVQVDGGNSDDVYIISNKDGNYIDGINEEHPASSQTFQNDLEIYFLSKENIDIFREYIDSGANIEIILSAESDIIRYIGTLYFPDGELYDCLAKKEFNNLIINNKTVSEIINNSNNKIIDSILMNGNIIYQRQNDIHVNKKINTDFVYRTGGVFLVDAEDNGLEGKEIKYQANYGGQLVTYTRITKKNGYTSIINALNHHGLKCILFEGDEEYNSCLYENSNYSLD